MFLARILVWHTDYYIFFCYTFTNFWFNNIISLIGIFTELFVLFIFMFFAQVSRTTISFTWGIIGTTSLLIIITNVVFLIFKRREFFFTFFFYIRYNILFVFYLDCMVLEYFLFLWLNCLKFFSYYSCKEYVVDMVLHLIKFLHVQTKEKDLNCIS